MQKNLEFVQCTKILAIKISCISIYIKIQVFTNNCFDLGIGHFHAKLVHQ